MNNLDQKMCSHPCRCRSVEDAGVPDDDGTRRWRNHRDAPIEMATWEVLRAHLCGEGYEQKGKLPRRDAASI